MPSTWVEPIVVSRAYVYTYVTEFGEEGPPSEPAVAEGNVGETWTITVTPPTAGMKADRLLDKTRIYRTITGVTGLATYFFVAEIDIDDTSYADNYDDEEIATNNQLKSTGWTPPLASFDGFVAMPNGILASWKDNEVWFSEPYRPHAWPAAYQVSVDHPIVGLGVIGQTLVICTTGHPWTATGVRPDIMSLAKINAYEPCVSRRSIMSMPEGVYYASPNGLVAVVPGAVKNMTAELITPAQWNEYVDTSTIYAARFNTAYIAYECPTVTEAGGFLLDMTQPRISYNLLSAENGTVAFATDTWSSTPLLVRDGAIYYIANQDNENILPYLWKSKTLQTAKVDSFQAMRVFFTVTPGAPTLNPVRYTNPNMTLEPDMYGIVRLYADGALVFARELRTSGELWKLPSGYKAELWQVEVEARIIINEVQMATSAKELAGV